MGARRSVVGAGPRVCCAGGRAFGFSFAMHVFVLQSLLCLNNSNALNLRVCEVLVFIGIHLTTIAFAILFVYFFII